MLAVALVHDAFVRGGTMIHILPALVILLFAFAASGHEMRLADDRVVDYAGLTSPSGSDCCGNRDCRVVEWREVAGGKLEVHLPEFGWVAVPMDKVLPPHPDAPDLFHACYSQKSQALKIYCILPVGMGT